MACQAARKEVLRQLRIGRASGAHRARIGRAPMTAHDVWREIKWWTKETIREALIELRRAGEVCVRCGNYWLPRE
jgi:hypothetical protein